MDGILIEISNSRNRTMYAGISGAGNIMIILFPLIVGGLAQVTGYEVLFFIVSVITLSSIFFANKLDCRMKPAGDTAES